MNTLGDAAHRLQQVVTATRQIFGPSVEIQTRTDPEFPEDSYTVLAVELSAPPSQIVALEEEWATRVNEIAPGDLSFSLSLVARP